MGYKDRADQRPAKDDDQLQAVVDLLQRSGINTEDLEGASASALKLSDYQMMYKDADGEAQIVDLKSTSIVLSPGWEEGPQWPVIDRAQPGKVKFSGTVTKVPHDDQEFIVVLPDPQFGFMRDTFGNLIPFHDEQAIAASISFVRATKPDTVVILGDVLDLPVLSKYRTHPSYEQLMNPSIQAAYDWLAAIREAAGEARIFFLEGNHDKRLHDYVIDHAKALFGLRKAGVTPDSWPVLSVPYLLNLDDLGIVYVPGFPICRLDLTDYLVFIHGKKLKLEQVKKDEQVCLVQGHTHHAGVTYHQSRKDQLRWVASPGCLCRTDGAVPGVNNAVDPRGHEPIYYPQDWQQGVGVVTYPHSDPSKPRYEHAPIEDGVLWFRGREYTGANG